MDTATRPVPMASTDAATAPYPSARVGWTAVAVLFTLYVLSLLDRNLMTLLIVAVQQDLGATDFQMSLLYGPAFAIFFAIGGLPFGAALDRYSRRKVIYAGVTMWSLATVLCGLSRSFTTLFIGRAGVGAGEAVLVPGAQSIVSDMFPRERLSLPLSIYGLGAKVGGGLSLVLGGFLTALIPIESVYDLGWLGAYKGWHLVFLVAGVPGLLLAFLIFIIPEPVRRKVPRQDGRSSRTFVEYLRYFWERRAFFLNHHFGQGFAVLVAAGVAAWTPAFFQRVHAWSPSEVGHWLGLSILAGAVLGLPFHGWMSDHMFRKGVLDAPMRYLIIAWALALPFGAGAFLVRDPWAALSLLTVFFFFSSSCTSLPHAGMQLFLPSDLRGKAASVLLLVNGIGALTLGPLVVGALTDFVFQDSGKVGLSLCATVVAGVPLAMAIIALSLKPMRECVRTS